MPVHNLGGKPPEKQPHRIIRYADNIKLLRKYVPLTEMKPD
jgi:hypothetical protein